MPNWSQLRAEFPALSDWTYLDTASFGQLPRSASAAVIKHLTHRDETASSQFLSWFSEVDKFRESCAQLINSSADDIAFVPNASTGLSLLMQGIDWKLGDEILTLANEFPNQLYQGPSAARAGANFRTVPWSDFYAAISERTRLVLISTVNYATGFRAPINDLGRFLRERGILLYVDGTQSVGALRFDVQTVRPTVLCVDAYKWMMSPNGAGFLYVDPEIRPNLTPTIVGWRSDTGWREVNSLNHGAPVFADSAQRYEGGMLPFAPLYGMGAVADLLLGIGMEAVEARVLELAVKTRAMLTDLGGHVNSDSSPIVTVDLPGRDCNQIARELRARRIIVSARHGRLRISSHFYNDESDIEALRVALQ